MIELGIVEAKETIVLPQRLLPFEFTGYELYSITTEGNSIVISPASMTCPFCGRLGVKQICNNYVCMPCITQLKKLRRKRNVRKNSN
jgi:hypothetical protein